ncbi:hypothetical protein FKW77_005910 [Venturia effusa]|uniref:Uncharacterized protein n=1 Tax=Venturia effusa TaxID=50376 RepID=A0A517LLM3_9PEZI|nr:hypothetical protein FKW77_005910 [Venturia effusa]
MFAIKSLFLAALSLSALTFAAPIDTALATTTGTADGCTAAFLLEHRACESGREQKLDGAREELKGQREIEDGRIGKGVADLAHGIADQAAGKGRECRTGGLCL